LDNTVKTLIIVVIILVAVLGVASGVILQSYLSNNNKNATTVNQTNVSVNNTTPNVSINNTTTNQTTKKTTSNSQNDNVMISAKKAERIATNQLSGYEVQGTGASLSEGNGHPIWIVTLRNPDGSDAGQCAVDATTGKFLG